MANNVERCGTMALHDHLMRTDPAYAEARSRSEEHHWACHSPRKVVAGSTDEVLDVQEAGFSVFRSL